jgi:hypothetical protein
MQDERSAPESTAVRVALWRALHAQIDAPPHVLEDEIGLRLVAPDEDWRQRPDMDPDFTKPFRASIVARGRFIEDLLLEQAGRGGLISQRSPPDWSNTPQTSPANARPRNAPPSRPAAPRRDDSRQR